MRKRDELNNPNGCMARARLDEMTFVLLCRDEDAPDTIRDWIKRRIKRGKNRPDDQQMIEAERCARVMEYERVHGDLSSESPEPDDSDLQERVAKNKAKLSKLYGHLSFPEDSPE